MNEYDRLPGFIEPILPIPTSLTPNGKLGEKVQCLLFDVYGTLFISSSGDISIARKRSQQHQDVKNLLIKYQIKIKPRTLLKNFFDTIALEHDRLKKKGVDFPEVEIDRIWARVLGFEELDTVRAFAVEFELIVNPVYPMPNLEKMLSGCKQSNVLMGIISNAQFYTPYLFKWFFESSLQDLGFESDLVVYSYKTGHAKPSTFMFEMVAKTLLNMNIPAYSTLYIGNDMLNDILPAKKTGFKTALFAGDARSLRLRKNHHECQSLSPDIVITDLIQVLDFI